jgi:aspartate racemase
VKTAGLVGGLGPESTIDYYRRIIDAWRLADPGTAPSLVIDSIAVNRAMHFVQTDRGALVDYLLASVRRLAGAGVDFVAITANTPHIAFDEVAAKSPLPLISIVEVCAKEARTLALRRPLLLGTRFTVEADFYPKVFARHAIELAIPGESDRQWVHDRYVGELLQGDFRDDTRAQFIALIDRLRRELSIDSVILGGTELPLLLKGTAMAGLPVLDTTALHVKAIVEQMQS